MNILISKVQTSTATTHLNPLISALLPKLTSSMYKGQNGKVGVIGGSQDYTGAPYYAAAASLKAGADISHIFCTQEASLPIKSYSPEFIVHPCLNDREELLKWLDSAVTSVVIGPGLGRHEENNENLI
jgi:ATP-dependent NAD(P)H-hydrate dehydratase